MESDDAQRRQARRSLRKRVQEEFARVNTPAATLWPRSIAGVIAGVWASAMSLLLFLFVTVLAWVLAPMGSGQFGDVVRASASIWLLSNGGALQWQGASLSLPPLLLTLVLLLFMRRAGGWLADAVDAQDAAGAKQSYGFAIAAVATMQVFVGAAIQNDDLHASLGRSIAGASIVSAIGFGWGLGRVLGIELPEAWHIHRVSIQRFLVSLTAAASGLALISAIVHWRAFSDVVRAVAGDVTSTTQLLLTCVVYLPTLVIWVISVLLGPGFALGAGTQVALNGVSLGALPPIPLLALIPTAPPVWATALYVLPLSAAVWATRPVPREEDGRLHLRSVVELVLLGVLGSAALALMASGGIGPGRLMQIGPVFWQSAIAGGGWLAIACVGDELVRRVRRSLEK